MSDYDTDVVIWSERQADLLRRVAAGERVNDQVDWTNVIEEVESVGQSQVDAVESLWTQASNAGRAAGTIAGGRSMNDCSWPT
jgi:hypothetical protein